MTIPAAIDLADGNPDWMVFVGSACVTAGISSLVAVATQGRSIKPTPRFGFLLVTVV